MKTIQMTVSLLLAIAMTISVAYGMGQNSELSSSLTEGKASASVEYLPLSDAFSQLEKSFGVNILYDDVLVNEKRSIPVEYKNMDFPEALFSALKSSGLSYRQIGEQTYVIVAQEELQNNSNPIQLQNALIRGRVIDENGSPIPNAHLHLAGTSIGGTTNMDGHYVIRNVPAGSYTLQATFLGFRTVQQEITVSEGEEVTIDLTMREDMLAMDALVVSGTPGGSGIRKKDASFAITTISAVDMDQLSPSSTAEALNMVPGIWSESSGGVAGANIFVRGMPSAGDAPFVTMAINGAPIFGTQTLSFFEQSSIFRIDETVAITEALRGGPNSVFSNGESGLTTNFNLKKGTDETQGLLKYTSADYNKIRLDGLLSGPVSDNLFYMVGGYIRNSPGVRDTEFNSETGQQVTFQITRTMDRGVINAFARVTNDHGQWVLPMALETGNDRGTFAQLGNATRFRELQINSAGDTEIFDFARGRGWSGLVSGVNADFDLGSNWMLRNNLVITNGDANTFGFVPEGSPIRVSDFTNTFPGSDVQTRGGRQLSGNDWIQNYGHWVVLKELEAITNDLSINKRTENHNITLGTYTSFFSSNDFWTIGNQVAVHNSANGDLLSLGNDPDATPADIAQMVGDAGGGGPWAFGLQSAGDSRVVALYAADSWQLAPALRFDVGARYEWVATEYALDMGPGFPNGEIDRTESLRGEDWAFTAALNYDFTDQFGAFGRFSRGFLFPNFDNIREDNFQLDSDGDMEANQFLQYEAGLKFDAGTYSVFVTGYLNDVDVFDSDVGSVRDPAILNTQTLGVEVDGGFRINNFNLRAVGTLQSGEIKDASPAAADVIGNDIWRQPNWQFRVAPSYDFNFGLYSATLYGALRSVGDRWDSRGNVFELDGYSKLDLGLTARAPGGITLNVHIDNLNDSDGLTEGDPRDPVAANGRPIFGRSVQFSVGVNF